MITILWLPQVTQPLMGHKVFKWDGKPHDTHRRCWRSDRAPSIGVACDSSTGYQPSTALWWASVVILTVLCGRGNHRQPVLQKPRCRRNRLSDHYLMRRTWESNTITGTIILVMTLSVSLSLFLYISPSPLSLPLSIYISHSLSLFSLSISLFLMSFWSYLSHFLSLISSHFCLDDNCHNVLDIIFTRLLASSLHSDFAAWL